MSERHALIIDDNARNVAVLVGLLEMEGVSSTQVTNPTRLPDVLDTIGRLDVIFLDLEMPGLNGYDVLDSLKTDPRVANVPIVACTVHVSEIQVAYDIGFHGFLGKPLNPDKFPTQLARIFNGEPVWETV
ncbi:MAG: response regulator [Anaerolineae bacterium]|nr:response regulator [Anaerolineae bacterium]